MITHPKLNIDREKIFQLVNNKDWNTIIEVFKNNNNYNFIISDSVLKPFIDQYFINELLTTPLSKIDVSFKYYLQNFYSLHKSKQHVFELNEENFEKLIVKIIETETDLYKAFQYAQKCPHNEFCNSIIEKYNDSIPKVLNHSQENEILATENRNISNIDATICLFKSNQEYQFYKAVREVFQMYLVIPNVALNAILDFELIKNALSTEEKKYFFSSLVDCVVIDTENNYKPIKFIELDSPYHDTKNQQLKDAYKDNIFSKAGQKLLRIRRDKIKNSESDFAKIIRELLK